MDTALRAIESAWDDELEPRQFGHDPELLNTELDLLRFVMDRPALDETTITFGLWVENPSEAAVRLATSGFGLMPNHLGVPYIGPPLPPPAPPMRLAIRIPACSRVLFPRSFRLEHYRFMSPTFIYNWTFSDHHSQLLAHGSVTVELG